jgi:hypothetical protein
MNFIQMAEDDFHALVALLSRAKLTREIAQDAPEVAAVVDQIPIPYMQAAGKLFNDLGNVAGTIETTTTTTTPTTVVVK